MILLFGRKQNHAIVSAGSYLARTEISAGSKKSKTASAEAKYDGWSAGSEKLRTSLHAVKMGVYPFILHKVTD